MSYHSEANAFRDRLAANWATTPIDWGGGFGGRKYTPVDGQAWIRPGITSFRSAHHALRTDAGNAWRFPGEFYVQVFVPDSADNAAALAEQYADTLSGIFRAQTFSGVVCADASVVRVGRTGAFFQVNVLVRFRRDERL